MYAASPVVVVGKSAVYRHLASSFPVCLPTSLRFTSFLPHPHLALAMRRSHGALITPSCMHGGRGGNGVGDGDDAVYFISKNPIETYWRAVGVNVTA